MNTSTQSLPPTGKPTEISSLYIVKAIFALFVVAMHSPPFESFVDNTLFAPFALVAVPIFYAITGYFLFSPEPQTVKRRSQKMLTKALGLTLSTNLLYFGLHLFVAPREYELSWQGVLNFLAFGTTIEGVLWYLLSLVYALGFYTLIFSLRLGRYLGPIAVIMGVSGLLLGRYSFVLGAPGTILVDINAFSVAIPYVTLGYYIKKHEKWLMNFRWELPLLLLICLSFIEVFALRGMSAYWGRFALTLPLALGIICFAIQHKDFGTGSATANCGKRYSGLIYYFHYIGIYAFRFITDCALHIDIFYQDMGFVYIFLFALVLAIAVDKAQNTLGWKIF
ncbi:MAG: hypothetical protein SOW66_06035 [Porphyromonas sp.]|nr:hypothetical protein [Porphyromonas sp.]